MIRQHFSSSPAASGSKLKPDPDAPTPPVVFEAVHSLRKMTLNRPKALNTITYEMANMIKPQLEKWESSDLANVILFKGNGRAFCAGGDVKALVKNLNDPATQTKSAEFFEKEYSADAFISKMKKPVVTFMSGATMGGGLGLSMHAPFRVATETTQIAMPETKIGLFPDVGANFFLARLDGALGEYLAMTSESVTGIGAFLSGFATHYVSSDRLDALEARLSELPQSASIADVNSALEEFSADSSEFKKSTYPLVGLRRRAIDAIFSKATAEEIVADLKALAEGTLKGKKIFRSDEERADEGLKSWAKETYEKIEMRSPTSVKLSLLGIREGKTLDIDNAFRMDMRIATACVNPGVHPDFATGVNHLFKENEENKKRKQNGEPTVTERPAWKPSTLEEVDVAELQKLFFSSPPPFDNPPLPLLPLTHPAPSYKAYPHASFGLPSEKEIKDIITGEAKGSADHALTVEEVIQKLLRERRGKQGVREKATEVIARKCSVTDGFVQWRY